FRSGLAALQWMHKDHILIDNECSIENVIETALKRTQKKELYIFNAILERARWHMEKPADFLISCHFHFQAAAKKLNRDLPDEWLKAIEEKIESDLHLFLEDVEEVYQIALLLTLFQDSSEKFKAEWNISNKGRLSLFLREHCIHIPKGIALVKKEKQASLFLKVISLDSLFPKGTNNLPPESKEIAYAMIENDLIIGRFERILFLLAVQNNLTPLSKELVESISLFLLLSEDKKERAWLARQLSSWLPDLEKGSSSDIDWIKAFHMYSYECGIRFWDTLKTKLNKKDRPIATLEVFSMMCIRYPNHIYSRLEAEKLSQGKWKIYILLLENQKTGEHIVEEISEELSQDDLKEITNFESIVILLLNRLSIDSAIIFWSKVKIKIPSPSKTLSELVRNVIQRCFFSKASTIPILIQAQEQFFFINPSLDQLIKFWNEICKTNVLSTTEIYFPVLLNFFKFFKIIHTKEVHKLSDLKFSVVEVVFHKGLFTFNQELSSLFLTCLWSLSKSKQLFQKMSGKIENGYVNFLKQQDNPKNILEFFSIMQLYGVVRPQDETLNLCILKCIERNIPTSHEDDALELMELFEKCKFKLLPQHHSTTFMLYKEALKYGQKDKKKYFNNLALQSIITLSKDKMTEVVLKILDCITELSLSDCKAILNDFFTNYVTDQYQLFHAVYEKKKELISLLASNILLNQVKNFTNSGSPAYHEALYVLIHRISDMSNQDRLILNNIISKIGSISLDLISILINNICLENSVVVSSVLLHLDIHGVNDKTIPYWRKTIDAGLQCYETTENLLIIFTDQAKLSSIYDNEDDLVRKKARKFLRIIIQRPLKDSQLVSMASIAEAYYKDTEIFSVLKFLFKGKNQAINRGLEILEEQIDFAYQKGLSEIKEVLIKVSELTSELKHVGDLLKKFPWKKIAHYLFFLNINVINEERKE
ncbi:MAG: hypothetical protein H0W50_11010, partial [Parachlamydiaceae bacterium]|nr:hypothetical protein [Parachlamydiaceae bacterium]